MRTHRREVVVTSFSLGAVGTILKIILALILLPPPGSR